VLYARPAEIVATLRRSDQLSCAAELSFESGFCPIGWSGGRRPIVGASLLSASVVVLLELMVPPHDATGRFAKSDATRFSAIGNHSDNDTRIARLVSRGTIQFDPVPILYQSVRVHNWQLP